jgi:pimeloyl-ACP methyl ester carboxylesterase
VRPSLLPAVAALCLATACGAGSWGTLAEAAGERQRVECAGTELPAVVFVHGLGDEASSASFEPVIERLPGDRRWCRYDRPGAGDSPAPAESGRDADDLDRELDAVVREADDGPVVLVGHSFGSYPVLHYARTHTDRVAGLVLLDGVEPNFGLRAAVGADDLADVPMAGEALDLGSVQEQTAAAVTASDAPLGDLPLVVVARGRDSTPDWTAAQRALGELSSAGELRTAAGSGHQIPADAPGAVVEAIRAVAG